MDTLKKVMEISIYFLFLKMRTKKQKNLIKTINGGKQGEYKKDFMELKFSSDDYLSFNKLLKFHMLTVVVRSVFEEDGKYYPHILLGECFYEL